MLKTIKSDRVRMWIFISSFSLAVYIIAVLLAHFINIFYAEYINVTTLKRSYHLNVIKILTNSGNFFFLELPPEIKHHVGLAESLDEYRKVLGVVL